MDNRQSPVRVRVVSTGVIQSRDGGVSGQAFLGPQSPVHAGRGTLISGTEGEDSGALAVRDRSITWAAVLFFVEGISFSLTGGYALTYMVQQRDLPTMFGIRASSGGFIEPWGIDALIVAQTTLVVASLLEIVVGYALWRSQRLGAIGAFGLFPVTFFLGLGLLLPARLVIDPLRLYLVTIARRRHR